MKVILLLLIIALISQPGHAQSKYKGQVFGDHIGHPLAGVSISNQTSHTITTSGTDGKFTINAKVGDILTFNLSLYRGDTVLITNESELSITLISNNTVLNEVKIKSTRIDTRYTNPLIIAKPFNTDKILYQTDDDLNNTGGLKFMLDRSGGYRKDKIKQQKLNFDEQKEQEISGVFSADNLKKYVPISGQELENFMILYRPDVKTYCSSGFNLPVYISKCYKEFNKIPAEKRQSKEFLAIGQ